MTYYPPVTGDKLFRPLTRPFKGTGASVTPQARPAYSEATLLQALRSGRDANGRTLNELMPRYLIGDEDARLLIAYLKQLSSRFSPGAAPGELRFATVVGEEVPLQPRQAMLAGLGRFFGVRYPQLREARGNQVSRFQDPDRAAELPVERVSLSRWTLKGAPETWRAQLEEHYRREPVFALVGGLVPGPWRPIHEFCEEHGIPCLYPNTELPPISERDWYTLYQSRGYHQEGEAAARFLNEQGAEPAREGPLLVVAATPEARALAAGFRQAWQELGRREPKSVELAPGEGLDRERLRRLLEKERPAALLLWGDATLLPALEGLETWPERPGLVLLSGRYLGERLWELGEPLRRLVYLTYPYAFSVKARGITNKVVLEQDRQATLAREAAPARDEAGRVALQTEALTQLLTTLLTELKGDFYRDRLVELSAGLGDQTHPLYGRVSLGSGRYASQGCYIVQLSPGGRPELTKKSEWLAR